MNELLFRQAIFDPVTGGFLKWHYWGLLDGTFVGVDTGRVSPTKAVENSQRFTGLTDKNKVRIYEGDIVKVFSPFDEHEMYRGIVSFRNGGFYVDCKVYAPRFSSCYHKFEVIGNIWEHKELLENPE